MRRDAHPVLPVMIGDELHDISGLSDSEVAAFKKKILGRQKKEKSQA